MKSDNGQSVFFDSIAKTYAIKEKHDYEFPFRKNALSEAKRFIAKAKRSGKRALILEAGCGNGALTLELLKYPEVEITAVDFSQEMLNVLRARIAASAKKGMKKRKIKGRVKILKSDIRKLSFKHRFDIALLVDVFINVGDRFTLAEMIGKTSAALKENGILILSINSANTLSSLYASVINSKRKFQRKLRLTKSYVPKASHNPEEIKKVLKKNSMNIIKEIPVFLTKNPAPVNLAPPNVKNKCHAIIHGRQNICKLISYVLFSFATQLDVIFKSRIGYIIVAEKKMRMR